MRNIFLFSLISVLFLTCTEEPKVVILNEKELKEPLMDMNKAKVRMENEQIDNFLGRYKWPVIKTGTGLRYYIYKTSQGELAKADMRATIDYTLTLLNGDTAYTTKETGPETFLIEMDEVESGLHEGIQLMKVGESAKLILPSYLAHGLIGDSKKIPPRTTIIYDLTLIQLAQ